MAKNKYHEFFYESDEGVAYIKALEALIDNQHQKAENTPDLAIAFTQRAKGIREAIAQAHIMSVEVKKPGTEESKD